MCPGDADETPWHGPCPTPVPTYCTPEDVAMTLDLPDPDDNYGYFQFTDVSHPSYEQVCRMICSNEDIIDQRLRQSWRVNRVKDYVTTIQQYQWDEAGVRTAYFLNGGYVIPLRRHILEWDPDKGDKLELRSIMSRWYDVSDVLAEGGINTHGPGLGDPFWFDYEKGRLFLRLPRLHARYNAMRISYRYGSDQPVPAGISRLCCLLTAMNVINMQSFSIKVGLGGDISGVKDSMLRAWTDEINTIYSSFQRSGTVHGMLRGRCCTRTTPGTSPRCSTSSGTCAWATSPPSCTGVTPI